MLTSLYDVNFHTGCGFAFLLNQKMVSHFPGLLHYDGNAHVLLVLGLFKSTLSLKSCPQPSHLPNWKGITSKPLCTQKKECFCFGLVFFFPLYVLRLAENSYGLNIVPPIMEVLPAGKISIWENKKRLFFLKCIVGDSCYIHSSPLAVSVIRKEFLWLAGNRTERYG